MGMSFDAASETDGRRQGFRLERVPGAATGAGKGDASVTDVIAVAHRDVTLCSA